MARVAAASARCLLCSRTHPPRFWADTLGSRGSHRDQAACCLYQEVEAEVKNLIPPPPDNYTSLGTVSLSDILLYTYDHSSRLGSANH